MDAKYVELKIQCIRISASNFKIVSSLSMFSLPYDRMHLWRGSVYISSLQDLFASTYWKRVGNHTMFSKHSSRPVRERYFLNRASYTRQFIALLCSTSGRATGSPQDTFQIAQERNYYSHIVPITAPFPSLYRISGSTHHQRGICFILFKRNYVKSKKPVINCKMYIEIIYEI